MIEEETSTPPPPPPTDPPSTRRELRRSRDNRVFAGVAGGIARYFDIDPVIVRIAFVVLALFGGSGVLLYLVAWLVIAKEGEPDTAAVRALRGDEKTRNRGVIAVLLILAAVFLVGWPVLWVADFHPGSGLFFPLLLVAAGVALLLWPDEDDRPRSSTAPPPPVATTVTEPASTALVPTPTPFPPDSSLPAEPAIPEPIEDVDPRRSFPIGTITSAALLVVTGVAVLLDRTDVIDVRPVGMLATWLLVVGVGLVVSAFVGRSAGLIVLGLFILPFLWFATVVDIEWWSGTGEEHVVVTHPTQLLDTYHHGVGQLTVDLSELDLDGEEVDLKVGLTIGEVIVTVPDDTEVVIDLDGRIGEIRVERPGQDIFEDGFDLEIDTVLPGSNGRILLDLDIGIGEGRVEVAA